MYWCAVPFDERHIRPIDVAPSRVYCFGRVLKEPHGPVHPAVTSKPHEAAAHAEG
jgi:hypothetical protein